MSEAVRNRRAGRSEQGSLIDNTPLTKPAKTPMKVIRELVDKWGLSEATARGFPCNVAFAVMYQHREGRVVSPARKEELKRDLAAKIRKAVHDADFDMKELCDLTAEAVSFFDRAIMTRVVSGLAVLLDGGTVAPPKCAS